jgi:hypothetical protein
MDVREICFCVNGGNFMGSVTQGISWALVPTAQGRHCTID